MSVLMTIFLHADAMHLLGNLAVLATVGPRVCRVVGWWRLGSLFLISGVLANASAAVLLDSPIIGASGAVAGVMAAHLVLFPRSRLAPLICLWIALQAAFAGIALDFGGVAWPAHLVGAALGAGGAHFITYKRRATRTGALTPVRAAFPLKPPASQPRPATLARAVPLWRNCKRLAKRERGTMQ